MSGRKRGRGPEQERRSRKEGAGAREPAGAGRTPWLLEGAGGLRIRVHASPGARREGVLGVHGDALRVAVRAAPERGRANEAIEAVLAGALALPRRAVAVERGHGARLKTVRLHGVSAEAVRQRLAALL